MTYEECISKERLLDAYSRAVQAKTPPGLDGISIAEFDAQLENNINRLLFLLDYHLYEPMPANCIQGKKKLYLLGLQDKIVCYALQSYLSELVERQAIKNNYGYRVNKSSIQAVAVIQEGRSKYPYGYLGDIAQFFPHVSREKLSLILKPMIEDERLYQILVQLINQSILSDGIICAGEGLLPGSPLAPSLSNLYLGAFDRAMERRFSVYVRYSDDFYLGQGQPFTKEQLKRVEDYLNSYHLTLNKEKSSLLKEGDSFTFLGHRFLSEEIKPAIIKSSDEPRKESMLDLIKKSEVRQKAEQLLIFYESACDAQEKEQRFLALSEYLLLHNCYAALESLELRGREEHNEKNEEMLQYYHLFFNGIEDRVYTGCIDEDGMIQYEKINGPVTYDLLPAVRRKYPTLAIVPEKNQESRLFILDFDLEKQIILEYGEDNRIVQKAMQEMKQEARRIQSQLLKAEIYSYMEYSGQKGYHLWIFLEQTYEIKKFWESVKPILQMVPLADGIHLEKIPSGIESEEKIKLPDSIHPVSLQRTYFLMADDSIPTNLEEFLSKVVYTKISSLVFHAAVYVEKQPMKKETSTDNYQKALQALESHCIIVKCLLEKLERIHYLTHYERLSLLYIYGHMGQNGANTLHEYMKKTINYNAKITQKFLDKIQCYPVSCDKLRKRFPINASECCCDFTKFPCFYPSPILWAYEQCPDIVTKPDLVDKEKRLEHVHNLTQEARISDLKDMLLLLTAKQQTTQKEIEICKEEIRKYFQEHHCESCQLEDGQLELKGNEILLKLS